jgi:hypothetical protein
MPPVKTVASSPDVDNEATAELPVLDVAAYEATLGESIGNTDTWTVPASALPVVTAAAAGAVSVDVIPTLRALEPQDSLDLSGTHEMPPYKPATNKLIKATPVPAPAATNARGVAPPPTVVLPPSPPLIEELRGALAADNRPIEALK